jgi:competence protein ComEC
MRARLSLIVLALFAVGFLSGAGAPPPRGLDIYFIDVMGGAATLIVTPERESILIDSGWPGFEDRDPLRIVHVLKDVAGCDHLDHLVTTHWHRDHFGGVEGLSRLVRIDHFWDRGLPDLTRTDADISEFPDGPRAEDPQGVAYRKISEGKRKALKAGDSLPLKGNVKALVLTSGGRVIDAKGRYPGAKSLDTNPVCDQSPPDLEPDRSDNARSLSLLFSLGRFGFLDCGDLTWNVEKALVCPADLVGQVDLFQVTHHGMDISNHPAVLKTVAPTVSVMDNGPTKGGSATTAMLLSKLPTLKAAYQLHRMMKTTDAENTTPELIANKDPSGGQFIQANIAADGSKFSVRIGTDGAARTFDSK